MILRLAPKDWQRFRRVRLASLVEAPQAFCSDYPEVAARPQSSWTQQLNDLPTWVIPGPDRDLGVVRVDPSGVELISLWVAPEGRGQGLGRALVEVCMTWARQAGHPVLSLQVKADNQRAMGLYEAMGFERGALEEGEWWMRRPLQSGQ